MKTTFLLFLSFLCFVSFAQSYINSEKFIRNFINSRRFNWAETEETEISDDEYSRARAVYSGPQNGLKAADKISSLPGQPEVDFDHYSGYVTVDPSAGRALFYYFAQSSDPSAKPLVLWLNGGPGCSSFANGAMLELGPFRVNNDNQTLKLNPYSWNKVTNVLFLDSPAGVGFSYSNTSSDYLTDDRKTAFDAYIFLINWLERFPEYKTRDFYITGESYAGHYIPQLAYLILNKNRFTNQTIIRLKGISAGNAYIDKETETSGTIDFLWSHALISDEIYAKIVSNCNYSSNQVSKVCEKSYRQAYEMIGQIYDYDIYYPLCFKPSSKNPISGFDPCSEIYTVSYFNNPQVQRALHVNVTGKLPGPWYTCTAILDYKEGPSTVLDVIQKLMASGIKVWLYSGDVDMVVSVTTTRYAIEKKLKPPVKTPWYPWYYQKEVGGYVVEYQNLTFVTVRGAGHLVPSYQPGRALAFFTAFLLGSCPLPTQARSKKKGINLR